MNTIDPNEILKVLDETRDLLYKQGCSREAIALLVKINRMFWPTENVSRSAPTVSEGASLIAAERRRQVEKECFDDKHDDLFTDEQELIRAAVCYTLPISKRFIRADDGCPAFWPWEPEWWKPTPKDRVRELAKAGALIAAEIDRLNRKARR